MSVAGCVYGSAIFNGFSGFAWIKLNCLRVYPSFLTGFYRQRCHNMFSIKQRTYRRYKKHLDENSNNFKHRELYSSISPARRLCALPHIHADRLDAVCPFAARGRIH